MKNVLDSQGGTWAMKVTLVDFDGVLFRNPKAMWYVSKRSSQFVHKTLRLPGRHAGPMSENINRSLYTAYGHTALGLQKLGYPVTLGEYNEFVYDNMPYQAFKMTEALPALPVDCYVFSNAPLDYCEKIAGTPLRSVSDVLGKPHNLKPLRSVFDEVDNVFPGHQIFFVDDSMINFVETLQRPNWVNVLYIDGAPTRRLSNNLLVSGKTKINEILDTI